MKKTTIPTPFARTSANAIPEAFLHYIWKTKNFDIRKLLTTDGEPIRILDYGSHNYGAGPDFLNGKIDYRSTLWLGHIEIHVRSSDWYKHHHQLDPAYDQVVLHVVYEDDRPVTDIHMTPIPTIELRNLIDLSLLNKARAMVQSRYRLPCKEHIGKLSTFWLNAWKERQLVERLESRTMKIKRRLDEVNGDWEQVAFEFLARGMGFYANAESMEQLAIKCSWKLMRKLIHDENYIAAFLFGSAGLIPDHAETHYVQELKSTFNFIQKKYSISSQPIIKWNFKSARPANFPTVRIAQLAALLLNKNSLIRAMIEATSIDEMKSLFICRLPDFWKSHYVFHKRVKKTNLAISNQSRELLLVNCAITLRLWIFTSTRRFV